MRRAVLTIGALALAAAVGVTQYRDASAASDSAFSSPTGKAFLETYNALRQDYLKDVKPDTLLQGAIAGMVGSLKDEFTYYLSPTLQGDRDEEINGEFFGVGATLVPANGDGTGARVDSVFRDSPAARAGVQAGDVVIKVNGKAVSEQALNDIVKQIRGPKGTTATLVVVRGGTEMTLKPVRDRITLVSVSTTILPGNVGYVALADFLNKSNIDGLKKALANFANKKVSGVVLDLRDNGGGFVSQAVEVTDAFLAKGDIFITRGKDKKVSVESRAAAQASDYKGPLVVLVNEYSASASEIVAASLHDNGRAKVVGETTIGKGVANSTTRLANGGQVYVATEEWLRPDGQSLLRKGLKPDYAVDDTRYEDLMAITGVNAKPGANVKITVDGKTVTAKADAEGRFTYQDEPKLVKSSDRQGQAVVTLSEDAQLRKALQVLGAQATK
jgi:carboxyl-terminal processing protease